MEQHMYIALIQSESYQQSPEKTETVGGEHEMRDTINT